MKILRRLFAVILTVAVALTALSVTVSADSIEDTAKSISSGQTVQGWIPNENDCEDYKITAKATGKLVLDLSINVEETNIYVYDENGERIKLAEKNIVSGSFVDDYRQMACWNKTVEKFNGKLIYKVSEGNYYIRIKRCDIDSTNLSNYGNGNFTLNATVEEDISPTSPAATDGSILSTIKSMLVYFTVDIPKGSTLQLGAITPNLSVPISWTSHNTNVATIATNGEVTAKAKGSAYIAIRFGPNVRIVQVNVV